MHKNENASIVGWGAGLVAHIWGVQSATRKPIQT